MYDDAEQAAHHKQMSEMVRQHITPALRTVFRDHTGRTFPREAETGQSTWGTESGHEISLFPPYPKSRIAPEDRGAHLDQWRASVSHPGNEHDTHEYYDEDEGDWGSAGDDLTTPHYEPLGSNAAEVPQRLTSYLSSKRGMGLMRDLAAGEYEGPEKYR